MVDIEQKINAYGCISLNARGGKHDDLATAAALAWWWSTRPKHYTRMGKIFGF